VFECGECGGDGASIECWDGSFACAQEACPQIIDESYYTLDHLDPESPGNSQLTVFSDAITSLSIGDEIGIFDGDLCVGAAVIHGEASSYTVIGEGTGIIIAENEQATNPTIDGFTFGHEISYRYWDASAGIEITSVNANYTAGYGEFDAAVVSYSFDLTGLSVIEQTIELLSGWNRISFNNEPDNMSMFDILCV
jgi:hypothetical protein